MKKIQMITFLMIAALVLGACGKDQEETKSTPAPSNEEIGFSMEGESIEEAEGVPKEEKEALLEAFDTYIQTMNDKDLEGYMATISEDPASFTRKDEEEEVQKIFKDYDFIREPSNITIVKYDEKEQEAQVFSNMDNKVKQLSTGLETKESSRQVTLFAKEDGGWKVKSVHAIGENPSAGQ